MANPTTNYGWPMPTATDLVTDLPADFAAFGQPVDTSLKALNPETTLGDIAYRSATANTNTRLAIGSTGNVLTVAGGVPTWAAPAAGGKLLQVVQGTTTTTTAIASTTMTDTGLSASITPTSATSKVLVLVTQSIFQTRNDPFSAFGINILRGSTTVFNAGNGNLAFGFNTGATGAGNNAFRQTVSLAYMDSPATTSATTYKTQAAIFSTTSSGSISAQSDNQTSVILLLEIGA